TRHVAVHAGEVLLADQLQRVRHLLEQDRGIELQPPEPAERKPIRTGQEPAQAGRAAEQVVGPLERLVELRVQVPHLEQLGVREFDHRPHILPLRVEQQGHVGVDQRRVVRPEREARREGVAHFLLFAYDVAHAFDLAAAETRLASATQRQTVKQKRRAPAFFEYDPAPLRVTEPADSLAVGGHVTAPYVEFVLYDFGAVSVSYAIPLQGPLTGLPALSTMLYGNEQLQADSRRRVQQLIEALGDAAIRSRLADFVEDYVVF